MAQKTTNILAGLPSEASITSCTRHANADELHITFPDPVPVCPDCGSFSCVRKDHMPFRIRHTSCGRRAVILSFSCTRYKCSGCGRTFTARPDWIDPSLRVTRELFLAVRLDLAELLPMSAIARVRCIPAATMKSVLDHISLPKPDRLPATLCIDEFKGDSREWNAGAKKWDHTKFHCSIADGGCGAVVDILPSAGSERLIPYLQSFTADERRRVQYFCCDMHNAYPSLAKRFFPNAVICIDLFHVVKRLNDAVDEVRRRLQHELLDRGDRDSYERLKHSALLLKTAESNRGSRWGASFERKGQRLDAALAVSPDLQAAYDMLQGFHRITATPTYALQRVMVTEWIQEHGSSEVPEVRSAVQTVRHWRGYIQNTFKYGKSNGPCEGLNNKIKVIKRISFGVHDFESFRKRILLTCGYIHWDGDTSKYAMTRIPGKEVK